jgi:hypothetical protein
MTAPETCFKHEAIERNTALIPDLRTDVSDIKTALLGTMDRPGWLGRIALVEKQQAVIMRVAWGILGCVGLAVGGSILGMVLK